MRQTDSNVQNKRYRNTQYTEIYVETLNSGKKTTGQQRITITKMYKEENILQHSSYRVYQPHKALGV